MVRPLVSATDRPQQNGAVGPGAEGRHQWAEVSNKKRKGATVIWVASAAAVMTVLLSLALSWWLVRRESGRWRRFRQTQGEPEVVARRVAAKRERSQLGPVGFMVFRSATNRWEAVGDVGRRRPSAKPDQGAAPRAKRRSRGNVMMVSCWPVILLDVLTRL